MSKDDDRDALREVLSQIRALRASIGRDLYEMGRILFESQQKELHLAAGRRSFTQWVESDLDLSAATASRALDIYAHYSPAIAARYGPEKLHAGVAWLRATPEDERPGDLVAAKLRLRADDGRFVHKRFNDAKAVEVWNAVALLEEAKRGRARIPRVLRAKVESFTAKLPPGPKGVRADNRIRLLREAKTGALFVTFTAIPLAALGDFASLVRDLGESVTD